MALCSLCRKPSSALSLVDTRKKDGEEGRPDEHWLAAGLELLQIHVFLRYKKSAVALIFLYLFCRSPSIKMLIMLTICISEISHGDSVIHCLYRPSLMYNLTLV